MKINISEIEVKDCWECPLYRVHPGEMDRSFCMQDNVKAGYNYVYTSITTNKKNEITATVPPHWEFKYPCDKRPCPKEIK
jgi:hypothetical protein